MLLTRSPLSYPLRGNRVRLACVRHAASVDSEPGSNSHVKGFVLTSRREQLLTRAPVDLALALFRTVFCQATPAYTPPPHRGASFTGTASLASRRKKLTLDGSSFPTGVGNELDLDSPIPRAVKPSGGRSKPLLCLHALSSFQRTGFAFAHADTCFCIGGAPAYPHRAAVTVRFLGNLLRLLPDRTAVKPLLRR